MKTLKQLILIMISVSILAGYAASAPRLTIAESSFNFGFVPQHSKISHDFWLLSTGEDVLKILRVVPG